MDWIQELLNGDKGSPLQLVLITLFLVICLVLIVWIVRRIAGSPARRAGRGRIPRLSITDSAAVDDKRYIVMVRRDNVEHLLLIGGPTDVVVETGIVRVQPVATPSKTLQPGHQIVAEKPAPKKAEAKSSGKSKQLFGAAAGGAAAVAGSETVGVASKAVEAVDDTFNKITPGDDRTETTPEVAVKPEEIVADANSGAEPDTPELEPNIEDTISQSLDDALSAEDFNLDTDDNVDEANTESKKTAEKSEEKPDDEMQRLLEELAGESKEPA